LPTKTCEILKEVTVQLKHLYNYKQPTAHTLPFLSREEVQTLAGKIIRQLIQNPSPSRLKNKKTESPTNRRGAAA
jgi:hypothetical protein